MNMDDIIKQSHADAYTSAVETEFEAWVAPRSTEDGDGPDSGDVALWMEGLNAGARATIAALAKTDENIDHPRTVTTLEELRALPDDTVIRDDAGYVYDNWVPDGWVCAGGNDRSESDIKFPATVLTPAPAEVKVHWCCNCVPEYGPPHCHTCDDDRRQPIEWDQAHGAVAEAIRADERAKIAAELESVEAEHVLLHAAARNVDPSEASRQFGASRALRNAIRNIRSGTDTQAGA